MSSSVSVVVPTYNRGAKVQSTLDSVLSQTLRPLEILVVDDGSVDGTPDWIEAHYGDRVRVFRQENGGVARARNFGLEQARGEFIAYLDHDDLWMPHKLEKQVAVLQNEPPAVLAWCRWQETENGQIRAPGTQLWEQPFWKAAQGDVFDEFVPKNLILSASIPLIRRSSLLEIGGFDPACVPSDDYDLWLRLARRGRFVFVPDVLVVYNWHAGQQSRDEIVMWRASQRALIKHWPRLCRRPRALWLVLGYAYFLRTADPFYQNARKAVAKGDWRSVRREMLDCFRRFPLMFLTAQWIYIALRLMRRDARPF